MMHDDKGHFSDVPRLEIPIESMGSNFMRQVNLWNTTDVRRRFSSWTDVVVRPQLFTIDPDLQDPWSYVGYLKSLVSFEIIQRHHALTIAPVMMIRVEDNPMIAFTFWGGGFQCP